MTEEEKKKYTQKTYTTGSSSSSYTTTFKYEPVKEKSLRITVKGSGNTEADIDDGNVPPS